MDFKKIMNWKKNIKTGGSNSDCYKLEENCQSSVY